MTQPSELQREKTNRLVGLLRALSGEAIEALRQWIEASRGAPGWLDGWGLGRSYIDSRTNGGKGIGARRAYVRLDHATFKQAPELGGAKWRDVERAIAALA